MRRWECALRGSPRLARGAPLEEEESQEQEGGGIRARADRRRGTAVARGLAFGDDHEFGTRVFGPGVTSESEDVCAWLIGREGRDSALRVVVLEGRGVPDRPYRVRRHGFGIHGGFDDTPLVVDGGVLPVGEEAQTSWFARPDLHRRSTMNSERSVRVQTVLGVGLVHDVAERGIAGIAWSIPVTVQLVAVRVHDAVVQRVRDAVVVHITIAGIAVAVPVCIFLVSVHDRDAVVKDVQDEVLVQVGVAVPEVGHPIDRVPLRCHERADVEQVGEAISIVVLIAGVAEPILVRVELPRVVDGPTVVAIVLDLVAIQLIITLVADLVAVGVCLFGCPDVRAEVARVADAVAVEIGLVGVELERAVVVGIFDPILVIVITVLLGVPDVRSLDDDGGVVVPAAALWIRRAAEAVRALAGAFVVVVVLRERRDGREYEKDGEDVLHVTYLAWVVEGQWQILFELYRDSVGSIPFLAWLSIKKD